MLCELNCSNIPGVASDTCLKASMEDEDGKKAEKRACVSKAECEKFKANCDNAGKTEESKIKKCSVSCCTSDLCNNAFSVSPDTMFIVTAAASLHQNFSLIEGHLVDAEHLHSEKQNKTKKSIEVFFSSVRSICR